MSSRNPLGPPENQALPNPEELFNQLKSLGLTTNEAKVYVTALGRTNFKASEVAEKASVPRPKVYEALNGLVNKGFCDVAPGPLITYSAMAPQEAIALWEEKVKAKERSATRSRQALEQTLIAQLTPLYTSGLTEDGNLNYITVKREKNRLLQAARNILGEASHELLVFEKPPFAQDEDEQGILEAAAVDRGVNVRFILETSLTSLGRVLGKKGVAVRMMDSLPMKLIICDSKLTLCALRDPITGQQSLRSLTVDHPDFAEAMRYLFEAVWAQSNPISLD